MPEPTKTAYQLECERTSAIESAAMERAGRLHDEIHEASALVNLEGSIVGWAPEDSIPILARALVDFTNTQTERLSAENAAKDEALAKVPHAEDCEYNRDRCAACGEEFDSHPNTLTGDDPPCDEFINQPCNCYLSTFCVVVGFYDEDRREGVYPRLVQQIVLEAWWLDSGPEPKDVHQRFNPLESISDAFQVVEKMRERGWDGAIDIMATGFDCQFHRRESRGTFDEVCKGDASCARAICLAAIAALGDAQPAAPESVL